MQVLLVVDPAGALHFDVEAFGEHLHPFAQQRLGLGLLAVEQRVADLAFLGRGQRDQALRRRLDPVALDDDLAVALAFAPAAGNQLGEIAVAPGVHRQQAQAAERTVFLAAGEPDVGPADRLDAGTHGGLVELHQRTHVALVGDRHRRHAQSRHRLGQGLDPDQAVDQGEFGMQTQVNEGYGHEGPGAEITQKRQGPDCTGPGGKATGSRAGDARGVRHATSPAHALRRGGRPRCPARASAGLPGTGWHRRSAACRPCAGRCSPWPA